MPSTYTTNLGIEKIATGEQSGTWGTTTNTNFDLIDTAVNGIVSITLASAGTSGSPNDLPITDGTASNGRNKFIEFVDGGDLGATAYVQLTPNDAEKIVHIRNSLSGSRSIIVFQGTYNASNDFEIPNGADVTLKFDGAGTGATVTDVNVDLTVTGVTATSTASFSGATIDDLGTVTTADINGGTIDGTVIGGSSAAAGTFTTFTSTGIDDNATSTAITIDSSENVVLGNTSTSFDFEIYRSGASSQLAITGGNASVSDLLMGDTDDNNIQRIRSDHSDNSMQFQVNNSERMRIDASGNVILNQSAGAADNTILRITGGTAGFSTLHLADTADINIGFVQYDHTNNALTFASNNAERMRIDSSGRVGIGTTSPQRVLVLSKSDSTGVQTQYTNSTTGVGASNGFTVGIDGSENAELWNFQNTDMLFSTNSTERMRIDSSGSVGIGTSSPNANAKFEVVSTNAGAVTNVIQLRNGDATAGSGAKLQFLNSTVNYATAGTSEITGVRYSGNYSALTFTTYGPTSLVERMRIDGVGNVGIGTASPSNKLTVASEGKIQAFNSANDRSILVYNDNNAATVQSDVDPLKLQSADRITFNTNGANERMRIDSSGNVGIGTSSPDALLNLEATQNPVLRLGSSDGTVQVGDILGTVEFYSNDTNAPGVGAKIYAEQEDQIGAAEAAIVFETGVTGALAERMRINSDGLIGIGTASPSRQLVVYDSTQSNIALQNSGSGTTLTDGFQMQYDGTAYLWNYENSAMLFGTNSNERMRIDADGNVGIGVTTVAGYGKKLQVHSAAGGGASVHITDSTTGTSATDGLELITFNSAAYIWNREASFMSFGTSATERMRIDSSGNVGIGTSSPGNQLHVVGGIRFSSSGADAARWNVYWNSTTGDLIVVSSDARLKKDFDYDIAGIETVNKLKPVRYTWKENNKRQLGFTAQESLEADEHLAWHDTENDQWGLDGWEGYAAVLTKAIQEQQAMIEKLKAEVAALKGA